MLSPQRYVHNQVTLTAADLAGPFLVSASLQSFSAWYLLPAGFFWHGAPFSLMDFRQGVELLVVAVQSSDQKWVYVCKRHP
jgi:hypothetical protein